MGNYPVIMMTVIIKDNQKHQCAGKCSPVHASPLLVGIISARSLLEQGQLRQIVQINLSLHYVR